MSELSDLLQHLSKDTSPSITHDGMIERLQDYASRFGKSCAFKVGDIVTARRGGLHLDNFIGQPFIVLDVFPATITVQNGEAGTPEFMRRVDMRVAQYFSHLDSVVEQVVHSIEMEDYTEPVAQQAEAAE